VVVVEASRAMLFVTGDFVVVVVVREGCLSSTWISSSEPGELLLVLKQALVSSLKSINTENG
jgi:hypothetical protein